MKTKELCNILLYSFVCASAIIGIPYAYKRGYEKGYYVGEGDGLERAHKILLKVIKDSEEEAQ